MLSSATLFADGREANRPDHIIIRFCSRSYSVWTDFLFSFLFLGLIPSCLFAFAWSYQLFSSVHDRPGCRNLAHVRRLCACDHFLLNKCLTYSVPWSQSAPTSSHKQSEIFGLHGAKAKSFVLLLLCLSCVPSRGLWVATSGGAVLSSQFEAVQTGMEPEAPASTGSTSPPGGGSILSVSSSGQYSPLSHTPTFISVQLV